MVASSNARSCFPNRRPRLLFNLQGRFRNVRNPGSHGLLHALETTRSSLQCVSSPPGSFRTLESVGLPPIPSPTLPSALLMLLSNRSPSNGMLSTPNPEYTTHHTTVDLFRLLSNTRLPTLRIKSRILRGKMLSRSIQTR